MKTSDILILVVVFSVAGFRLYQKYSKKGNRGSGKASGKGHASSTATASDDDDYEPYSGK